MTVEVRPCERCEGSGTVSERANYCPHTFGNCECECESRKCPDCGGTGDARCEDCREHTATTKDGDDDLCAACADLRRSERDLNMESDHAA